MRRDTDPILTLTQTHALMAYPRQRETRVAEILGRIPGHDGTPERIYLRTLVHQVDREVFKEAGAECWSASGAISTVLERHTGTETD